MKIVKNEDDPYEQKKHSDSVPSDSDIPESTRVRCSSGGSNEIDRFLLDYNGRVLFVISPILYIIFQIIGY